MTPDTNQWTYSPFGQTDHSAEFAVSSFSGGGGGGGGGGNVSYAFLPVDLISFTAEPYNTHVLSIL